MITNLELHSLQSRRRDQRLKFMFTVVEGCVPAIPPDKFLHSQRRVQPKRFTDCVTVKRLSPLKDIKSITRCLVVTATHTNQFKNSYFVKTV